MNHTPTPQTAAAPTKPSASIRGAVPRRLLQVLLCLVVCVITLAALLYTIENWRGKRAWSAYEKTMDAKGEILDFRKLVPPPVPDDQNFAMTPFLAPLLDFHPGTQTYRNTNALQAIEQAFKKLPPDPSHRGDWRKGQRTDLGAWLEAFHEADDRAAGNPPDDSQPAPALDRSQAAAALLAQLKEYDPILDELRAASRRPHARFNLNYERENPCDILLPHLAKLRTVVRVLNLRASVQLALGQPQAALQELTLSLDLANTIRNEPMLISHLVRCAILQNTMQPIWEGFADRQWSKAELEALEQRFAKFDFLADDLQAMRGERAWGNGIITYVRQNPRMLARLGQPDWENEGGGMEMLATLIPRGWFFLEQVNYNRLFEEHVLPGIDSNARQVDVEAIQANADSIEASMRRGSDQFTSHRVLSNMLIPALGKAHQRFVYTQSLIDLARIACALEQHRLAAGELPDSLVDLTPRFLDPLPHDLITGQPLNYRRTDDRGFQLYGVGWNQTDDGGQTALKGKAKGRETVDLDQGDWAWRCP